MDKSYMKQLDIQISNVCNLQCKHCVMKNSMTGDPVNFDKIEETINNHPEIEDIFLTGGEPLLIDNERLLHLITNHPNIEWMCSTNLVYELTPIRIEVIKKINSVATSFDIGIRFGNIRNLSLWYHNVKRLISEGIKPELEVYVTLTKQVLEISPFKWKRFFDKLGICEYKYRMLGMSELVLQHPEVIPTKEEFNKFMNEMLDVKDYEKNMYPLFIKNKYMHNCNYTHITPMGPDGEIHECIFAECYECNCKIDPKCLACKYYKFCGGRCPLRPCMFDIDVYNRVIEEYKDDVNFPIMGRYREG